MNKKREVDNSLIIVTIVAIVAISILIINNNNLNFSNFFGEKLRIETIKKESLIFGCMNPEASNYNPDAVLDDGSCENPSCQTSTIDYISHEFACSGEFVTIYGQNLCTPMSVLLQGAPLPNNLILSSTPDEVKFIVPDYYDGTHSAHSAKLMYGGPQFEWWNGVGDYEYSNFLSFETGLIIDGLCLDIVLGCTDESACNYDANANVDGGSCYYCGSGEFCENEECRLYGITYDLHEGNNLISFPLELTDSPVEEIFGTSEAWEAIFTEEEAAIYLGNGNWVGSLSSINPLKGYGVIVNQDHTFFVEGVRLENPTYELHEGNNLISFPHEEAILVSNAFPDEVEPYIIKVKGENSETINSGGNWEGNLTLFEPNKGYWVLTNHTNNIEFSFNQI